MKDTVKKKPSWLDRRKAKGEQVGGGFWVFRRGKKHGRIAPGALAFEHPSMEAAEAECRRLAKKTPGETFVVVRQATSHSEPSQ